MIMTMLGWNMMFFPVANPDTSTMNPLSRKDGTVSTNYPVATKEHNKAVSKSYLK